MVAVEYEKVYAAANPPGRPKKDEKIIVAGLPQLNGLSRAHFLRCWLCCRPRTLCDIAQGDLNDVKELWCEYCHLSSS
jgi:hypothetical protein